MGSLGLLAFLLLQTPAQGASPDSSHLKKFAEGVRSPDSVRDTLTEDERAILHAALRSEAFWDLVFSLGKGVAYLAAYSLVGDPFREVHPFRELTVGKVGTDVGSIQGYVLSARSLDFPQGMGGVALGAEWVHLEEGRDLLVLGWSGLTWTLGGRHFPVTIGVGGSYLDATGVGTQWGVGGYLEIQPLFGTLIWPVVRYDYHTFSFTLQEGPGNTWGPTLGVRLRLGVVQGYLLWRRLHSVTHTLYLQMIGVGLGG